MKDFVSNLQDEIKRLKTITEDLMAQIKQAGSVPEIPETLRPDRKVIGPGGKIQPPFKNICPDCSNFKNTQRPTSAGRVRPSQTPSDFRIRKAMPKKNDLPPIGFKGAPTNVSELNVADKHIRDLKTRKVSFDLK